MGLSARSVNRGSRRVWPAILTMAGFFTGSSLLTACLIIDDDVDDGATVTTGSYTPPPDTTIMAVSIDPAATINADPGEGVGMYVEYAAGGHWRVSTTCDSTFSGIACMFRATVSAEAGSALSSVQGENLEGDDAVVVYSDGSARLDAETGTDVDGVTFDAPPGASIRLEMYLDDAPQKEFVYWFGDGVLHTGAPTDPVDFVPTGD